LARIAELQPQNKPPISLQMMDLGWMVDCTFLMEEYLLGQFPEFFDSSQVCPALKTSFSARGLGGIVLIHLVLGHPLQGMDPFPALSFVTTMGVPDTIAGQELLGPIIELS
jgi:hypothetical protein